MLFRSPDALKVGYDVYDVTKQSPAPVQPADPLAPTHYQTLGGAVKAAVVRVNKVTPPKKQP